MISNTSWTVPSLDVVTAAVLICIAREGNTDHSKTPRGKQHRPLGEIPLLSRPTRDKRAAEYRKTNADKAGGTEAVGRDHGPHHQQQQRQQQPRTSRSSPFRVLITSDNRPRLSLQFTCKWKG